MNAPVCFLCGKEMIKVKTTVAGGWKKYKLKIENVDAYRCDECNEEVLDTEEVKMIQEIGMSFSELEENKRPDVLNLAETAQLLRVSNQSVYNMIKDGRLKAFKVGREWRFNAAEIKGVLSGPSTSKQVAGSLRQSISRKDLEKNKHSHCM